MTRTVSARRIALTFGTSALALMIAVGPSAAGSTPSQGGQIAQAGQAVAFNIPAQPLSAALTAFARQSGYQMSADQAALSGVQGQSVNGTMPPEEALNRLLAGTGLSYRMPDATSVLIERPAAGVMQLDPVTIQGQAAAGEPTAWSPVEGYVARRSATATKTDTPLAETPQAVSVITPQQMQDQGAQTIQDALRYTAGVRSETFGLDSRGDWSLVRGVSPVVHQDGTRQTFGFYSNARPDPFALERIEVVKGPSSVLYGQGSVGGIVSLQSKRPLDETRREVQVQYGSFDRKQVGVDLTGPVTEDKSVLYRVVAVGRDSDTQVNQVEDDRLLLMPSVTFRPTEGLDWTLLATWQRDRTGSTTQFLPHAGTVYAAPGGLPKIPTDVFMSEPGFDAYDTDQKSITSLLSYDVNDTWTVRQNMRYSNSEVSYQTIYPAFPPVMQANGDIDRVYWVANPELNYLTVDTHAQANFTTGPLSHVFLGGVDYQNARTTRTWAFGAAGILNLYNPSYGGFTPPSAAAFSSDPKNTVTQVGVYAQDQVTFDNWTAVFGLRHDRAENATEGQDTQKDTAWTKRLALMYSFDNGISPYVSYGESFEPIIGLNAFGQTYDPLKGEQFEVGVKYQPPGSNSIITAAAYDLREKNRQMPDPVNPRNQIQAGEAQVRGVELEGLVEVTPDWNVIATYSFTETEVLKGAVANQGKRIASVPEHMASLWTQHDVTLGGIDGFSVGGGVRFVGASWDGTDTIKTPGTTLFDAKLGYGEGPWEVSLNGTNLTDEVYYTTCLTRGDCFVGNRRTFMATVSHKF